MSRVSSKKPQPKILLFGNLMSTQPMLPGHKEQVKKWAEHQAMANAFRDEDLVFHHSPLWLVLILVVFLMCLLGIFL